MKKLLLTLTIIFLVAGCNKEKSVSNSASPTGDSVKILSSSPVITESLKVGQKVKFSIDVEYTLSSSDTGAITLVIQDASNGTIANELYVAQKGTHKEKLEAEITVPETRAVVIFTSLTTPHSSSTTTVDSESYKVIK